MSGIIGTWQPLLSAEASIRMLITRYGPQALIVVELAPSQHSGPEPGIIYRVQATWKRLAAFGKGLNTTIRESIEGGNVVPGTNYTPVLWELNGQDGTQVRVTLTADDCTMIAHLIAEIATMATSSPE